MGEWAIDTANGNAEVEGVDLPGYSPPKPAVFACPVDICRCLLSAVIPKHRVSHFRTWPNEKHHPECDIDGAEKLVAKARRVRLDTRDERNFTACPARLILRDHRVIEDANAGAGGDGERIRTMRHGPEDADRPAVGYARRTVGTIRQICKAFLDFPNNRDLELAIPGIDGNTYLSAFKRISWDRIGQYPARKIFYSPLHWTRLNVSESAIEVYLDAGLRDNNKLTDGHKVVVDWNAWSKAKKTVLLKELEGRLAEAKEAVGTKVKAWLFFIGDQDQSDERIFRVNDSRLICCFADEFIYVQYGK